MPILFSEHEKRLAQRVLDCEHDAAEAALAVFERHDPTSLDAAARLIGQHGELSGEAFDRVAQAFDRYWHLRDMPCND